MKTNKRLRTVMPDGELSETFTTEEELMSHGFKNILETPEAVWFSDPYSDGTQTFYIEEVEVEEENEEIDFEEE